MTSTQISLVNENIDTYFTDRYGKNNFLSMAGLNESNWSKMVNGKRKMPNVYRMLMEQDEENILLKNALYTIDTETDTNDLISYLKSKEENENNALKIELDKYKSALRMVQNIQKVANTIIEKVER